MTDKESDSHSGDITEEREAASALAWRPWQLISSGDVAGGLAVLDDDGTWWEMAGRSEQPMSGMKTLLAEIFSVVPMTFEQVGSIVERNRVALMVESAGQAGGNAYRNAYTFITTVDLARGRVVAIREYVDTLHAATVLIPHVLEIVGQRGGDSALAQLLNTAEQET